jgi:hypothetical protein
MRCARSASMRTRKAGIPRYCGVRTVLSQHLDMPRVTSGACVFERLLLPLATSEAAVCSRAVRKRAL